MPPHRARLESLLHLFSLSLIFVFTSVLLSTSSLPLLVTLAHAVSFEIRNRCPYTVWAAAVPVGGGRRLNRSESWSINVPAGTTRARIWGRNNCNFDANGRGSCQTGDCNGLLQCTAYGEQPNTLAEFALNQSAGQDFIDISLVAGFNIPMEFSPTGGCTSTIRCTVNINGQCPGQLRAPGGCINPCIVFKTPQYCCNNGPNTCEPTNFSRFFKDRCRDAYSYPEDDATSMFTCPSGTNYRVIFYPSGASTNGSRSSPSTGKDQGSPTQSPPRAVDEGNTGRIPSGAPSQFLQPRRKGKKF